METLASTEKQKAMFPIKKLDHSGLLRFVMCGSVDDGKSTLIGRLLYDSGVVYADHLMALEKDSKTSEHTSTYDFSLLVDGLSAEREQKITLDVAYRFFATPKRAFIVADSPGHTQYTHNMATAASTAEVAVVLVDATKGLMPQTKRHSLIVALLGIKHVLLAVNKMDLVSYRQDCFDALCHEYNQYVRSLGFSTVDAFPVSALSGENITQISLKMPWYQGQTLIECLENTGIQEQKEQQPFRMSVQWVNRPHANFRGFTGRIASGHVVVGDKVLVLPSRQQAIIQNIVSFDGDLGRAAAGESITLTFQEPIDVSRGDVLASADKPCAVGDQLHVDLIWMGKKPMVAGRQYRVRMGTAYAFCTVSQPDYVTDIHTLERLQDTKLNYNQIGRCVILLDRLMAYELYDHHRSLGCLIITDKATHDILGAGMIRGGLDRASHIPCQPIAVDKAMRSLMKAQQPLVLWFTGLSGAGKSTVANEVEKRLHGMGLHTMLLDANNMRHGLNKDLGFSEVDRIENTRRIAEVAKLFTEAGLMTLVACIAPYADERLVAKQLIGQDQWVEVFVDAPLAIAEARDVRGLYQKARAGEIEQFTGMTSPYERPESPEVHLDTVQLTPEEAAHQLIDWLIRHEKMTPQ